MVDEESSSLVESMMDGDTTTSARRNSCDTITNNNNNNRKRLKANGEKSEGDEEKKEECGDVEVWDSLSRSFRQVQNLLDKNRELIRQANENHQSRIPDNITNNVSLIREINGNISKVVSIYSDLSVNFAAMVGQRRQRTPSATNSNNRLEADDSES